MTDNCWLGKGGSSSPITSICFGTGRFLRSVLVPLLQDDQRPPVLIQTRGFSFLEYLKSNPDGSTDNGEEEVVKKYPVETVNYDGTISTEWYAVSGAFSLATEESRKAIDDVLLPLCAPHLRVIGIGVTEKGLADPTTPIMIQLASFLQRLSKLYKEQGCTQKISLVNTDNVPMNGSVLRAHMMHHAKEEASFRAFLESKIVFHITMVDRIVSHRPNDPLVPRAEPFPAKALVVLDPDRDFMSRIPHPPSWLVARSTTEELDKDIAWKLRIANGTHTALACVMAVCGITNTDQLLKNSACQILLDYVDAWVASQVLPAIGSSETAAATAVWDDWRQRLTHPHFGLSTFFITQNSATKGGIRLGPTVRALLAQKSLPITVATAFAYASLLRFVTPSSSSNDGIFRGELARNSTPSADEETTVTYADGLRYNLTEGWYEFRCEDAVAQALLDGKGTPKSAIIRDYLKGAGQLTEVPDALVDGITTLYDRMVAGDDPLAILQEIKNSEAGFQADTATLAGSSMPLYGGPLFYRPSPIPDNSNAMQLPITTATAEQIVADEVANASIVDLHTHLLPPSHGALCLWGIDELLTYHYLVAEYFMTAPPAMTPEVFYPKTKQEQADLVWKALFVDRSPLSEASRGVVTTLQALGLENEVRDRDLPAIRAWYRQFRETEDGPERFSDLVHTMSGIRYNVMTNIPFDPNETQHWNAKKPHSSHYRTAVRVDPLLSGDRPKLEATLRAQGYDTTMEGAREFLRYWIDTLQPEYVMASTPHNFQLPATGYNLEAMTTPGAFAQAAAPGSTQCDPSDDDSPTQIDEDSDLLSDVLMKVCQERDLPVALKIGAHRQVNPRLQQAGDGIVSFADANLLARLCTRFPKVRFLATFLSRNNQQEACVLASKFSNLHIYGCWWYCFTPSIVEEITRMRFEMLGTAFTAQHSDARVVDQLIYKWAHSRSIIAKVLLGEIQKLCETGWTMTRAELRRDVEQILGGSYEDFLAKSME